MIRELHERPELLSYVTRGKFYELKDEHGPYAYLSLCPQPIPGYADVHIEMLRFGPRVLRYMEDSFLPEFHELCRVLGVRRVVGKKQGSDPRWSKFIGHFGFCAPVTVQMAYMEIPHG